MIESNLLYAIKYSQPIWHITFKKDSKLVTYQYISSKETNSLFFRWEWGISSFSIWAAITLLPLDVVLLFSSFTSIVVALVAKGLSTWDRRFQELDEEEEEEDEEDEEDE